MASESESAQDMDDQHQGDPESPFLENAFFAEEIDRGLEARLATLQSETPFAQDLDLETGILTEQPTNDTEELLMDEELPNDDEELEELVEEGIEELDWEAVGTEGEYEWAEEEKEEEEAEFEKIEDESFDMDEGLEQLDVATEEEDDISGEELTFQGEELHLAEETWSELEESDEACEFEEEAFTEPEASSPRAVVFPSGEALQVVIGYPEGKDQDYWDPTKSGNPLLNTGKPYKEKKLSENFTVRELTTSGGVSADITRIDPKLVECLQRIRDRVGKEVTITSGYRSWKRNKDVYTRRNQKATSSQHCGGRAADIKIKGMNGLEIGKAAVDACGPNIGIGLARNFAHIDIRGNPAAWKYDGVDDAWVREIKYYQESKSGKGKASSQGMVTPAHELVRFAQQVLNSAEEERLEVDGILGKLTKGALERFRKKYNLGAGSELDDKTQLALAQRALEVLRQQSLFGEYGVPDAATRKALGQFKSERGLPGDAKLDPPTLKAVTDELAYGRPVISQAKHATANVQIIDGKWGGWRGRKTKSTALISTNEIKDKYDLAVAVVAKVESTGAFDMVQMYDNGILSWGIKQWTLHRGSLQGMLAFIKKQLGETGQSSLWTTLFPGLDVRNNSIVVNGYSYSIPKKDGDRFDLALRKAFRGTESRVDFDKAVVDQWLTIFALAARHPEIQKLQFEYAVMSLKYNLNKNLGKVLLARKKIKKPQVTNYGRVGDYIENSAVAITLFNGMETQNPKYTYIYLKDVADHFARESKTHDTSGWSSNWQRKFSQELKEKFKESDVACWGRRALEKKDICKDRVSRTEKILRAYEELSPLIIIAD